MGPGKVPEAIALDSEEPKLACSPLLVTKLCVMVRYETRVRCWLCRADEKSVCGLLLCCLSSEDIPGAHKGLEGWPTLVVSELETHVCLILFRLAMFP